MNTETWWVKREFKGKSVWVRSDAAGEPIVNSGRIDVRYSTNPGVKIYSGSQSNMAAQKATEPPIAISDVVEARPAGVKNGRTKSSKSRAGGINGEARTDADFVIFTDGACSGNPGPAGSGVVVLVDGQRIELSIYLGQATNNVAELTAINAALEFLETEYADRLEASVALHSDSEYSIKVVTGVYKAKKNVELIREIQKRLRRFPNLSFHWVRGHVGIAENERADELARISLDSRRSVTLRPGADELQNPG